MHYMNSYIQKPQSVGNPLVNSKVNVNVLSNRHSGQKREAAQLTHLWEVRSKYEMPSHFLCEKHLGGFV